MLVDLYKPTAFISIFPPLLDGLLKLGNTIQDRLELLRFLYQVARSQRVTNIFRTPEQNLVFSKQKIERLLNLDWLERSSALDFSRTLYKLYGVLWLFYEAIYFTMDSYGKEIHGPYPISDSQFITSGQKNTLIIREFGALNEAEYNPNLKNIEFQSIRTYTIYNNVDFSFDLMNNWYADRPLDENTVAFYAEIRNRDNEVIVNDLSEVRRLLNQIEQVVHHRMKEIEKQTERDLAMGFILAEFFMNNKLRKFLGKDWRPSSELIQLINQRYGKSQKSPYNKENPPVLGTLYKFQNVLRG